MNYLTRPVFPLDPNWAKPRTKRLEIDLRKVELGIAAPFFAGVEQYAAQGYQFTVTLPTVADIMTVDDFFDSLSGNVAGFWFPSLLETVEIVEVTSTTVFYIKFQGLHAAIADQPDLHLWFRSSASSEGRAAKILSVVNIGDGTERITLTAPLASIATTGDMCCRLHYVRLATDEEEGEFTAEGVLTRSIKLIELPQEYTDFETGEHPIWLYTISCAVPVLKTWRFTSYPARVYSNGSRFDSFSMNHGEITASAHLDEESLEVDAKRDASHPFNLFFPLPVSKPMRIKVEQVTLTDLDTRRVAFNGFVRNVNDNGDKLTAKCESWASVLGQNVLGMNFQKLCNYHVFDDLTCKAKRWMFEVTGVVASIDNDAQPPEVVITLDYPANPHAADWLTANWFRGGLVDFGWGETYEARGILDSSDDGGDLLLKLIAPILSQVGDQVVIVPGCDNELTTCTNKFDNADNFGGFPYMPSTNLSLKAIDAVASQGGKK